jgi:hypothetical protein
MAARKTTVRPMDRTAVNAEKQTVLQRYTFICKSKQSHVCDIEAEELLTLGNDASGRAYCHLNVNNKSVYFMLDCGATVNLLPFTDASTVNPKLSVDSTSSCGKAPHDVRWHGTENSRYADSHGRTPAVKKASPVASLDGRRRTR